jgi:hypothetical protein
MPEIEGRQGNNIRQGKDRRDRQNNRSRLLRNYHFIKIQVEHQCGKTRMTDDSITTFPAMFGMLRNSVNEVRCHWHAMAMVKILFVRKGVQDGLIVVCGLDGPGHVAQQADSSLHVVHLATYID